MADTPISGFSSGAPAQSGDEFVIARSGANYKLTAANMKTFTIGAGSVSIASGKTLTVNNTLTLSGTDGTTMTFPSTSTTIAGLGIANSFTTSQNITPTSDVISLALRRNGSAQTNNILEIQTEANAFLAGFDKAGLLTLGAATRQTGIVKFAGTTSGVVSLSAADAAGTWTMKLPTTAGTNGYVLQTDGSGNTSWVAQSGGGGGGSPGGSNTQVQYNDSGVFGADANFAWNKTTQSLTITGLGTGGGANTGGLTVSGGHITLSGNISANAWTTNGIRYKNISATLTDLTSSGTVATAYTNVYGGNTIAASNVTTFTNYYTTWINTASAGTNVTLTNIWALGLNGALQSSGQSLTGSQNQSLLDLSATWNTSGTPTAIKLNVTNTSSNANSLLMDLQVGGTSQFNVNRSGQIVSPTTNASTVITAPALGAL